MTGFTITVTQRIRPTAQKICEPASITAQHSPHLIRDQVKNKCIGNRTAMDTEQLLLFFVFKVCLYEHENAALYVFKTI